MKIQDLKVRQKVVDRWYSNPDLIGTDRYWGVGIVKKITKTRVYIKFENEGLVTFDHPHVRQFIELKRKHKFN